MNLDDAIRKFTREIVVTRATKVFTGTCEEFSNRVIERTPQDTSNAIGNWQGGVGGQAALFRQDFEIHDPNGEMAKAAIASGLPTRIEGDTSFSLKNHKPYIRPLEDGYSDQAPAGMVGVTVVEFPSIVEEQVRK